MFDRDKFFGLVEEISATRYLDTDEEVFNYAIPKVEELGELISQTKRIPKTPNKFQRIFLNDRFNNGFALVSLFGSVGLVILLLVTPDKKLQNQLGLTSIMVCLLPGYIWSKSTEAVKKNLNLPTS
jgi:hypothetical protein